MIEADCRLKLLQGGMVTNGRLHAKDDSHRHETILETIWFKLLDQERTFDTAK
jgi:hypothetical protein